MSDGICGSRPIDTPIKFEISPQGRFGEINIKIMLGKGWISIPNQSAAYVSVELLKEFINEIWKEGYHEASIYFMNKEKEKQDGRK